MFRGSAVAACLLLFFSTSSVSGAARGTSVKPRATTPAKKTSPKPKAAAPAPPPVHNAPVPAPSNVASLPPPPPPPVSSTFELAPAPPPPAPPPVIASSTTSSAPSSPPPSAPIMPIARDRDRVEPAPVAPMRRLTVTLNPLPMIAGRYGANVELVPVPHHAVIASAYMQTFPTWTLRLVMPKDVDLGEGPRPMLGGELGYRFYTASSGASGLFIGPSGVAMPIAYPRVGEDLKARVVTFHAYGAALDVGAQIVTSSGFTFGGGIGVMALAYSPPASVKPPAGVEVPELAEPHVFPRLLLAAGWSF